MPRKVQKKDYKSLLENFKKKIQDNDILSNNALLAQQLRDFERMSDMNDNLWDSIQTDGYTSINEKTGVPVVNPAVAAFNKNASTLLKTAQWIEEKTKAISFNEESKSW